RHALLLFVLSIAINLGMWMERVIIVVQSLHHDFLPSAWGLYMPRPWDWVFLLGSICTFAWLFLMFIRVLPAISISEMRELVPAATFVGGMLGGLLGFFMQWYSAVLDYPINVGGRPLNSWPMFVPVTFEMTVLGAALAAFGAVIVGNGLPRLRHPVFDAPDFD